MSEHSNEKHEMKGYYTGDIHNQYVEEHETPNAKKVIWRTFWILLAITIFEVAISFTSLNKDLLQWIFVVLTVVKAGYIVMFFMHLLHEKFTFKYTILGPFALIFYLICIALAEGVYLHFHP
ncbi:MAG: cytochrome C oxidase subunit IV family protein [Bacteroidota bacterium]